MLTTEEALEKGFAFIQDEDASPHTEDLMRKIGSTAQQGYWSFKFGDGYELCFEPLLFNNQLYVALYKDQECLTEKVVVKPGYIKERVRNGA
jgi:hypothetical protein